MVTETNTSRIADAKFRRNVLPQPRSGKPIAGLTWERMIRIALAVMKPLRAFDAAVFWVLLGQLLLKNCLCVPPVTEKFGMLCKALLTASAEAQVWKEIAPGKPAEKHP